MEFLSGIVNNGVLSLESMLFLGSGLLGMICHYIKKRVKGQTSVPMKEYFGSNNPLSSIKAFAAYAGSMTGMLMGFNVATLSVYLVIILGVTIGWTVDSAANDVQEK